MVLLGLIDEKDAPAWATQYDPQEDGRASSERFFASVRRKQAESLLPAAVQMAARKARESEEFHAFSSESRMRMVRNQERAEKRDTEAVNSSRLESAVVAQAALTFLAKEDAKGPCNDVQEAAEKILFEMVLDEMVTVETCGILVRWQQWTERGGMNKEDLKALKEKTRYFCNAACLMGLFRLASVKEESSVALDIQECIRVWRKIRLG